jgi:hypothetical protein
LREIDIASWEVLRTVNLSPDTNPYTALVYMPQTHSLHANFVIIGDSGLFNIYLDRQPDQGILLSTIVDEICTGRDDAFLKGAGLKDADIDVSQLTDIVDGFVAAKHEPGRNIIEALRMAYFFDGVESDGKIKWPKRGGASVVTIPATDLAAHERGQQLPDAITTTRGQETELPRKVNVTYMNKDKDYLEGQQYTARLITEGVHEIDVELPLVLTDDHAKQISEILMAEMWAARNVRQIQLTSQYAYLDPADPIEVEEA